MCDHDARRSAPRPGSRLEDGAAHGLAHRRWSRRDFLTRLGLAAASAFALGGVPVRAAGRTPLLHRLAGIEDDRILVLVQLCGGNDGLNTIIPTEDDRYYRARPRLALPRTTALPLTETQRLHPSLRALVPLYEDGHLGVVQGVGYDDPDLSHFRSTDIWLSASDSDVYVRSGWAGRSLDHLYPRFEADPPERPLAVQLGGLPAMLFQGAQRNLGMALNSPEVFERLAAEGRLYDTAVPPTPYGAEMGYLRSVANDAFRYARAVHDAASAGRNTAAYPPGAYLAHNLAIIARLIKGGLGAKIYHVGLGGFDTHAEQRDLHALLLRELADSVAAFIADLAAGGHAERVLVMTFSEFGRRVDENGSRGTDHGTAAPLFFAGPGVRGGLYGPPPDLGALDDEGNLWPSVDFRQLYGVVLRDWFGFSEEAAAGVLGDVLLTPPPFPLDLIARPATPVAARREAVPEGFVLHPNYPNPFNPRTTLSYTLPQAARVRLRVYDGRGRLVETLVDGLRPAGTHRAAFDAGRLPSGPYFYRLETGSGTLTRTMMLVR